MGATGAISKSATIVDVSYRIQAQADSTGKGRGGVRGRESQIQALDCTAPILPLRPGLPESRTPDYVRHGTTTLWAALEVATGN